MLKKLIVALLLIAPVVASAQTLKFGNVSLNDIIMIMPERAAAEKEMASLSKKYEDEFMKMQEEYTKKAQEFKSQSDSLPENIKIRRLSEIQEIEQRIGNFRETAMEDIQKKQQTLMQPVYKKVTDAIKVVGQENKFIYIFDVTPGANGILYTGVPAEDVTPLVKTKLGLK